MDQLQALLRQRRDTHEPVEALATVAQPVHRCFVAAARAALGHDLARFARAVPAIEVEGERYHRVLRCETTSASAVGPVRVERRGYRPPQGDPAVCPLGELRAGILEGTWTPCAAKPATWGVAPVTPQRGGSTLCPVGEQAPIEQSARSLAHSAECPRGDAPSTL